MSDLKKLKNILKLDLINGFYFYKKSLIAFLLIMFLLNIQYTFNIHYINGNLTDLFFLLYKDIKLTKDIKIPMNWLVINIFFVFILGDFIYKNFRKDSNYILLKARKISLYWTSKCIWIILNVLFIYLIIISMTFLIGVLFLGFNFKNSILIKDLLKVNMSHSKIIVLMLTTYILTTISILFVQCILSLFLNSNISFLITILILCLSIVSKNKFFIGTHSMILRHNYFSLTNNLTIRFSIIYTFCISFILMFIGYKILKHKDFI